MQNNSVASPAVTEFPPVRSILSRPRLTDLPQDFSSMSLFEQLTHTFPNFRKENLLQEIAGLDPLTQLEFQGHWDALQSNPTPGGLTTFGIPPAANDIQDVWYIAIPGSSHHIRFYPGGTFAAQEGLYCMDIYDKDSATAIAFSNDWEFFKQLDLGQELMEYDPAADIFPTPAPDSTSAIEEPRRVRMRTMESAFGQPAHVAGKFMLEERSHCVLARQGFEDFHFGVPVRVASGMGRIAYAEPA
ncbi:hypothetical protein C8R46DRAFT_1096671 [Mycena filopes]|nr:hypothetical protein C8R46DRAFT_1096671 [Mycena filopes]